MTSWHRGTTPSEPFYVDYDLTGMNVYLSFKQRGHELVVKTNDDFTSMTVDEGVTTIVCPLTQEDTLAFDDKCDVEVQVRAAKNDGLIAIATDTARVGINRILQDGKIT